MERQMAFHILGLKETKDESAIQDAYRGLLRQTNPEDDPEGFKRLREAYEAALAWARKPEEQEQGEKTDIDRWIDRADQVYRNICLRRQPEAWKEVLEDPLCDDLDTSLQAREAMMAYLMDHIYLPNAVWKLFDKRFQIVEDRENLEQQFPRDFLNYVTYYIQNEEFINYSLFQILDQEGMDADAYIRNYLGVKRLVDQGEIKECREKLEALEAFGIYHPYQDVEMLRVLYALMERARSEMPQGMTFEETPGGEEAVRIMQNLLEHYGEDSYVQLHCGMGKWTLGEEEAAAGLWEKILEKHPSHYMAKFYIVRYLMKKEEYRQAKEKMLELLDIDGNDEQVIGYLHTANEALIKEYEEKQKEAESQNQHLKFEDAVDLARCYYQNEMCEEAISILEKLSPDEEQEYEYSNLFGRVLYRADAYDRACPQLKRWLELIRLTPEDDDEEHKKRRSREFRACHILSGCCHEMGDREQAMEYVEQAIRVADNQEDMVSAMQYKAYMLFTYEEYEKCIDGCDQVIEKNDRYFPAYLQRQEAAYKLKKGQQVVDDYYNAINIYNGYYKPYLLAAQTFFYHDQYEDAKGVLDRAKENGVEFSDNMRLYQVKILRNLAQKKEDRELPFTIIRELLDTVKSPETDIEDISELEYELALLYWDDGDLDKAVEYLNLAIEKNPDRMQYHMVGGHIYLDKKAYKKALEEYNIASAEHGESPSLHYNCGVCQEELGLKELALECYKKALEYKEGYRDACEKIANYYKERYNRLYDEADFELALNYINQQLKVRENCYYLVERGRIYMSAYKLKEAIKDFEKALEYVENDWASYNNMGCCYKYMGQFEKAIQCLLKAVECMGEDKSVLPYSNMADCYEALKQYEKAIQCYEKDLEMFPDRKVFRKEIGLLYQYMGDYENALKYFQMEPGLDDYYENMANVYYLQGKKKLAIQTYEEGIRKASKEDKSDRFSDLAYFYRHILRETKKAEYYYKKALAVATNDDDRHELEWKLAALYFTMGKRDNARLFARKSLEHFNKAGNGTEENYLNYLQYRPARLMRFGWIYICLGETQKGLSLFRQMTECHRCRHCRHRECFEAYQYLGRYYETTGDYEQALEYYEKAYAANDQDLVSAVSIEKVKELMRKKR